MQWILQDFEDTHKLAGALDQLGLPHSWHKVIPFVGDLDPEPVVSDPDAVVMFGSYSLSRYAEAKSLRPGMFRIRPFVHEAPWQSYMLNGPEALFLNVAESPDRLADDSRTWFIRPVSDSKEQAGAVKTTADIHETARKVLALDPPSMASR